MKGELKTDGATKKKKEYDVNLVPHGTLLMAWQVCRLRGLNMF